MFCKCGFLDEAPWVKLRAVVCTEIKGDLKKKKRFVKKIVANFEKQPRGARGQGEEKRGEIDQKTKDD